VSGVKRPAQKQKSQEQSKLASPSSKNSMAKVSFPRPSAKIAGVATKSQGQSKLVSLSSKNRRAKVSLHHPPPKIAGAAIRAQEQSKFELPDGRANNLPKKIAFLYYKHCFSKISFFVVNKY